MKTLSIFLLSFLLSPFGQLWNMIRAAFFTPQTWYVNPTTGGPRYSADAVAGGVLHSCNGTSSTPFNPSGPNNQNCPYNDFRLLYDDPWNASPLAWVISGGDIVDISGYEQGTGLVGEIAGAPGTTNPGDPCYGTGPDCSPPALPSGTSGNHTRIIGHLCSTSCFIADPDWGGIGIPGNKPDPAKIEYMFGAGAAAYALSWSSSQYVDIQGLDITDHAECGNIFVTCVVLNSTGFGIFAGNTNPATNGHILLQDVNLHGFSTRGIRGNCGGLWTFNRVEIANNGGGGVDFDPGAGQLSTNCNFIGTYVGIDGNGIVEQYPIVNATPWAVNGGSDDVSNGYGDGWGTAISPAVGFSCDHCRGNNNTQDAFDIGHWSGAAISFTSTTCAGNMGGCFKIGPGPTENFYNNSMILNCNRLLPSSSVYPGAPSGWNAHLSDGCRAGEGSGFNLATTSILYQSSGGNADTVTTVGTAMTAAAGALFLTGDVPVHVNDYITVDSQCGYGSPTASWTAQVTAIADDTHLTFTPAFPINASCGQSHLVKLAGSGGSTSSTVVNVYHNNLIGYEGTILGNQCQTGFPQTVVDGDQCSGYVYNFKDNIVAGYAISTYNSGQTPVMWADLPATAQDHNDYYNLRGCSPCSGTGTITTNPLFTSQPASPLTTEAQMDGYQISLTAGSGVKFTGVAIGGQVTDILSHAWASPPSMGAEEFGSGPPAVTGTIFTGNIQLNGRITF